MGTKITLENEYGKYEVEVKDEGMNIGEVLDKLFIPVLLAAGYSERTIEAYIGRE
jgi:hypothetical protein